MKKINKTTIINFFEGVGARRLAVLVSCVLVITIAWLLSGLIWSMLDSPHINLRSTPALTSSTARQKGDERDFQQLAQRPLFGEHQTAVVNNKKEENTIERKETSRPLVLNLLGIVYSPTSSLARAMIQEQGKEDGVYAIGAKISNQATVERITEDSVYLVLSDDKRQILTLPNEKADLSKKAINESKTPVQKSATLAEPDTGNYKLAGLREELITSPERIIEYIRFAPVSRGRQFLGFRVSPGKNADVFKQVGLRNGDVIKAVDQVPMDNPQRGFEVMQKIASAQQLELTVTRGGRDQNIIISF